jgi:hypothetical protein
MLTPVQQNSFIHLRVLLVLTGRGILPNVTSVVVEKLKFRAFQSRGWFTI